FLSRAKTVLGMPTYPRIYAIWSLLARSFCDSCRISWVRVNETPVSTPSGARLYWSRVYLTFCRVSVRLEARGRRTFEFLLSDRRDSVFLGVLHAVTAARASSVDTKRARP